MMTRIKEILLELANPRERRKRRRSQRMKMLARRYECLAAKRKYYEIVKKIIELTLQ